MIPVSCASAYMRYLPSTRHSTVCSPMYTARDSWRDTASSMPRSNRCVGRGDCSWATHVVRLSVRLVRVPRISPPAAWPAGRNRLEVPCRAARTRRRIGVRMACCLDFSMVCQTVSDAPGHRVKCSFLRAETPPGGSMNGGVRRRGRCRNPQDELSVPSLRSRTFCAS